MTTTTITEPHPDGHSILLVEGHSDRVAIQTLAERCGIDLAAEGIAVVEMGGATQIGMYLEHFGPAGLGSRLMGLYDAAEAEVIGRSLSRAGLGPAGTTADLEVLGFFMCVSDLEDELIRAVGVDAIDQVVEAGHDLRSFRTFQGQPAWRGRPVDQQFRRFIGAGARRKTRYAGLLVDAMDLARTPQPLADVLAYSQQRE